MFEVHSLGSSPWHFAGTGRVVRRLDDMPEYFPHDPAAQAGNPVIYEVFEWPGSGLSTDLLVTVTAVYPGAVGGEHHHTKGHFHKDPDGPELVVGLEGHGFLEMVDRTGMRQAVAVNPTTWMTIPPGWAHRVINPSDDPVLYLSVSSATVGHDYDGVRQAGWIPGA